MTPVASWALAFLVLVVLPICLWRLTVELGRRRHLHNYDQLGRVCVCDRCMAERFEVTP